MRELRLAKKVFKSFEFAAVGGEMATKGDHTLP
jgi:hypothetical protein